MLMKEMVIVKPTHLPHYSYIHATELAIQYMKEHLDEEVTSEQLAHLVGYSSYHFTRIFKKVTGISPRQYLSAMRMESSKQALLKQPSLIMKIMLSIGFRSAGSFHHRFKQFVGLSPKKFAATSSELASHMNQYEHKPLTSDTQPSSPRMCIHCQLETPPDFRGLLFVGLFPRPIPDQKPIVGTALNMRNLSINVADMTTAIDFYCNKLGFEISTQYDDNLVSLKHEHIPIVLCQVEFPTQVQYPRESQVVIGLQVEDLTASIQQYKQIGIQVLYDEPHECPPGIYNAIVDPFGNVIELLEYR